MMDWHKDSSERGRRRDDYLVMDLPPPQLHPPPPTFYRHQDHHRDHLRYGNLLHPPDFSPVPYGTQLPPPHLRPPHVLPPPPPSSPPPRVRYIAQSPLSPPYAFSPPHQPFLGRPHSYEFDPPPKPYFIRNDHPPPPPPPVARRENIPLRFIHDYPERNPIFQDEVFDRGCSDNYVSGIQTNCGRNMHRDATELRTRVPDLGDHERYRDSFYQSRGIFNWRDGDERGWDNGINDWNREMERDFDRRRWDREISDRGMSSFIERNYGDRRWKRNYGDRRWNSSSLSDWDPGTGHKRDVDGRRWNNDIIDWGPTPHNERAYDDKWNSGTSDRDHAMRGGRDFEERRWHYGIRDAVCELSCDGDYDESRLIFVGAQLKSETWQPEYSGDDTSLYRFSGRLERAVSKEEFIKSKKKRRLQKKNALHRIRQEKACSWHRRGYKSQHSSKKLSKRNFKAQAKEGSEQLQIQMEDKREEQSPLDLAISFKSNAFVAKAILATTHPAVESDLNSMDVDNRNMYIVSGSSFANSEGGAVKKDHLRPYLDLPSVPLGISKESQDRTVVFGSRSETTHDTNDANDNSVKNVDLKGKISQVPNTVGSGRTQASQQKKMRNAGNQLLGENDPQLTEAYDGAVNPHNCISRLSVVPQLISDAILSKSNESVELADSQESGTPELREDKYHRETHESLSSSETDASLLQKPEIVTMSDYGSSYAHSKEIPPAQVHSPQVGADAEEEFRNLDSTAVADCSNVSLGVSTSSNFLSVGHKVDKVQFDVPSLGAMGKKVFADGADQSLHTGSAEGSRDGLSCTKIHSLSFDCSSGINGKRKAAGAQIGLSDTKTEVIIDKFGSIGGEFARCLVKNLVPDVEVDFLAEDDNSKKDANSMKMSSGIEDSAAGVDFGGYGPFHGYMKKRKVVSARSNLSSLSDDDTVADGFVSDWSMLAQGSSRLDEWRTEQRELSASAATNKHGPTDVEGFCENWNVAGSDENLDDGNKLQGNDGLAFSDNHQSLCADDRNGFYASKSGNELLVSGFQMRSCMSSPEEMPSYSDLKLSRNSEGSVCQPGNGIIFWSKDISNSRSVPARPNTFSLGKSPEKAASSDSLPTNSKSSSSPADDGSKVVEKLNLLHGKLISSKNHLTSTAPRVFPGHHPICSGRSRISHTNHVTKSRTWHRTCNSTGAVAEPKVQPCPLPQSHGAKTTRTTQSSYIRKGNSLVRKASTSGVTQLGLHASNPSVYRLTPCTDNVKISQTSNSKTGVPDAQTQQGTAQINVSETTEELSLKPCKLGESLPVANVPRIDHTSKHLSSLEETVKPSAVPECQSGSDNNSGSHSKLEEGSLRKKVTYVKRRSNQLIAAASSDETSKLGVDKAQIPSASDGYYKSKKNQLVRASSEDQNKKGGANVNLHRPFSHAILHRTSGRRQSGFTKGYRSSKLSFVWKLHDVQSSDKHKKLVGPCKVWPRLFSWKKAAHWRSFIHALGTKLNGGASSTASQKLLLSRRGAIYKRSTHGYSLRMSKILSVSGTSLKWSKSLEKNSKKASEEATLAVAAAEKRKKEENGAVTDALKSRNNVSRERIFRIGSERYRMDPTRRTLHRITDEKESSSSVAVRSEKKTKRSYVPRRLLIGNDEYVRIGNGNQLVRDPKKRTRVLANEKVRWSLRTARLRLARKKKYCQFFTRFGRCNKDDGKCPYIHDPSKIAVCTKFLNGLCSNANCKLTHKVIPERMQDCSYFLKGSCSNENCPYRHVNVNPDSSVCESFLRGYCADGNECPKKHTYVCPEFEATGTCPQASMCKLHHPKKMEKKPTNEQKIVRGRYFDGGLITECSISATEKLSTKGKDEVVLHKGTYPDYISLDVSDNEMDLSHPPEQACNKLYPMDRLQNPVRPN